jgi:c-di-GMP-binding flagellar brake protein YcgR
MHGVLPKSILPGDEYCTLEELVTGSGKVVPFRRKTTLGSERRRFVRINEPVEAIVRGTDESGERFEFKTALGNLSAGGLYLLIPRSVTPGERLDIIVRLCLAGRPGIRAPMIAAQGLVLRSEKRGESLYGLAAEFLGHRFL